jgi:hypothetical protein
MVEVLCNRPEGRGFESRWGSGDLSVYLVLTDALGPGVYSGISRNAH